ncbi:AMP-binding protein [Actinocorallia sp. B10E7]|uniref:AMP-binding protein n=1 Tax=Actinocorallia sp. B10E7 TaxID=3153558 RepID=UPI00325DB41E
MSADLTGLPERLAAAPDRTIRLVGLDGRLHTRTFAELRDDVAALTGELRERGVAEGDFVGVLGPNCYDWIVVDLALLGMGCVSVALAVQGRPEPEELAELVERYRLTALLVVGRAVPSSEGLPPAAALLEERPLRFTPREWGPGDRPELPADVFTVAFSSGTSGSRKGLMLTRSGVMNTITTSREAWEVTGDDDILIVMPFSNFQQRYLMYLAIVSGCSATVVAPERMFQQLKKLEPTIVLGPPSFYEIVANRVDAAEGKEKLPYQVAALLHAALPEGLTRSLRARLGHRWTGMYGSRVRLMFTGSAPVPPHVVRLFQQLGAPLFEVYGSTEVGWIAFNLPGRHRTGTAGRPVAGIEVTLADDGEVVVRSPHPQAAGYVFDGVETRPSVFLPDGSITGGDLGVFEKGGFLRLAGRKKNVIITRSGVKINPEELELELEKSSPATRVLVASPAGDGLLTCVAWLEDGDSPELAAGVEAAVAEFNRTRDAAHRIAEVVLRPNKELTVENGLLTRNFKLDRTAVMREVFAEVAR